MPPAGDAPAMDFTIRLATLADAPGIAYVHKTSWDEAYEGKIPARARAGRTIPFLTTRWERNLSTSTGNGTYVAESAGRVVGFAGSGPARGEGEPEGNELWAIYVLSEMYGSGCASSLLAAALSDGPAFAWVLHDNERALAFYAKHGFKPDGATRVDVLGDHGDELHVVRVVRPVSQ